jgi:hypothetical protein
MRLLSLCKFVWGIWIIGEERVAGDIWTRGLVVGGRGIWIIIGEEQVAGDGGMVVGDTWTRGVVVGSRGIWIVIGEEQVAGDRCVVVEGRSLIGSGGLGSLTWRVCVASRTFGL